MGFFDRLKKMLGGGEEGEPAAEAAPSEKPAARRARKDRPPLAEPPPPSDTIEDVLAARAEGDSKRAREILRSIDRGAGLRTVLRAAAALEAGDLDELREIEAKVMGDAPWRLLLQTAAALGDARGTKLLEEAAALRAPSWALDWARCAIGDEDARRRALVDLLFVDAALARVVAARDLQIDGVKEDASAIARYAGLDAGRDAIHRFGAPMVLQLLDRVRGMEKR